MLWRQLVQDTFEQRQHLEIEMGSQGKLACCLAIILAAIVAAHSSPTEIAYRGYRCDRPTKLDYQIFVPRTPKPKKYTHAEYGYKVDVPAPGKAHVTYTFDFTVEEPRPPKPVKPNKWNLYAKVDRITPNKEDYYEDSYAPAPPSGCKCGQYDAPPRYVYKKVQPCKCQQPSCTCNQRRAAPPATSPNIFTWSAVMGPMLDSRAPNSIRRKRDTRERPYVRRLSRKREGAARPVRFVKLYHKNLSDKRNTLFDFDAFANPKPQSKRKTKKVLQPHLFSRKVKRDIKGEYDLLEKERDQVDLTLPEIVQYMPETLRPDFKRGQCAIGCASTPTTEAEQREEDNSLPTADDNTESSLTAPNDGEMQSPRPQDDEENAERNEPTNGSDEERHSDEGNTISNSLTKRNAANYNRDIPPSSAASAASQIRTQPLPSSTSSYGGQSAYDAKPPQSYQIGNNPIPVATTDQSAYSAVTQQPAAPRPQYLYDHLGRQYLQQNGRLHVTAASASVPDPTGDDRTPLRYAGNLDTLRQSPFGPGLYPVQHISNHQLDSIVSDIIYQHPDFIDATTHYAGRLVDPTPVQEQETKSLLKKLIDGRLNMWFGPGYVDRSDIAASRFGGYPAYK